MKLKLTLGEGVCQGEILDDITLENYEEKAKWFAENMAFYMVQEAMLSHVKNTSASIQTDSE